MLANRFNMEIRIFLHNLIYDWNKLKKCCSYTKFVCASRDAIEQLVDAIAICVGKLN